MAAIRSLGLHEPSAIPYLVAESLLPTDPSESQYNWRTFSVDNGIAGPIEDEIIFTDTFVVWSRGGVVRRSFRLDIEKEEVVQALFAHFPTWANKSERRQVLEKTSSVGNTSRSPVAAKSNNLHVRPREREGQQVDSSAKSEVDRSSELAGGVGSDSSMLSPALVVVLKSQAHIFFLSGAGHIIPLPFEVDSVWAAPKGLLFQRSLTEDRMKPVPLAPPNSFISSQTVHTGLANSGSFTLSGEGCARPSLTFPPAQQSRCTLRLDNDVSLPRVFSLVDPHSEMGLVVAQHMSSSTLGDHFTRSLEALDSAEEVLYVSSTNELPVGPCWWREKYPLTLVVTLNEKTGLYTIWMARYRDSESVVPKTKRKTSAINVPRSKRRSSHFDMTTGATTPIGRGPSSQRESFGGLNHGRSVSNISHTLNSSVSNSATRPDEAEDLASQLSHEFGEIGAPMKTSRRVSSLLARADLAVNHDRATFSDLASGNQSSSAMYGGVRRGESFGGYSNRSSFGLHRRSSLPTGNASAYSNGSSFLDAPVDRFPEGLNSGGDFGGLDRMDLQETVSGLPREMILAKVESFSSGFATVHGISSFAKTRKFEVFTLSSFQEVSSEEPESTPMAICILNKNSTTLTIVNLLACGRDSTIKYSRFPSRRDKKGPGMTWGGLTVRATEVQHRSNVVDCCKLVDGEDSRMLVLSTTLNGRGALTLHTPWSTLVKVELPSSMLIHEPHISSFTRSPSRSRDGGLKRVLIGSVLNLRGLGHSTNQGRVDIIDDQNRKHRIQIQLQPKNSLVKRILAVCKFVLRRSDKVGDGVHVAWWEVLKWLRARNEKESDLEWTAMVVTLFTMAVYFVESPQTKPPAKPRRRKAELLRSSSGNSVDLEKWEKMLAQEAGSSGVVPTWMSTAAWGWILEQTSRGVEATDVPMLPGQTSTRKNPYIVRCATLSREFLLSPQGETASGAEGYLPIAISRDHSTRKTALGTILVGLHLLREELKLSTIEADACNSEVGLLGPVLAQIGGWLGWKSWTWRDGGYYGVETASMDRWLFEETQISASDRPAEPFAPPSIFSFVESSLQNRPSSFLTLVDIVSNPGAAPGIGIVWEQAVAHTPRTLALTGYISEVKEQCTVIERVELLLRWGLTTRLIETLPDGISAPLHEAIARCQADPPASWNSQALELVNRDDLFMSMKDNMIPPMSRSQVPQSHDALRDVHHIGSSTLDVNAVNSFEISAEADRQAITRLIFREDRRFFEAARILNQVKAPVAECFPEPDWTESDLLEAQKELVQLVTLRTLSVPAGRAMMGFSGRVPLLTEKLPIPSFSLQCIMKPSNVTISADRTAFTEEKVCWAFFHNGASTGLAISKGAKGIDTSWILYNKPIDLTNRHAGFLLALGLNGHLRSLAKWVAFKYLTPKHTMTSIGLLLGLSASYLGTMDTLITRLLSVHVTRMLPPGTAELNLSPLTQTTGIMGIGLLYCNSQHRRMSEVMLSEIENLDQEEPSISQEILRDEGYRLAAGFALGFINLGKGKDLKGLRDMHIVERLLALAVGTKNVDIVHVLDRATAGATIALAIIFMKSNDLFLAEKIDIPDTTFQFDYVRPDIFLLRTLARHLIMWDSIIPSHAWVKNSLPSLYRPKYRLTTIRRLRTDDMPLFNIVAGICFAVGLRFAGSASPQARDLLISYLDQFIRICRLPAINYDGKLARNSVRNCQDIVALSAATVMAGTGDLAVFRRLRALHGRTDAATPYGSHMAAHMAVGMIFLGGGTYTLGTSDLAVASLLCSFYPVFPTTVLDNKCHLQAFRHLWALAAEPRCLIPRDLDTCRPVTIPVSFILKSGEKRLATAPCLLPSFTNLVRVEIQSSDYWALTLDFASSESLRDKFRFGNQSVYLRRRAGYNACGSSIFSASLMALSDAQDIASSSMPGYSRVVNTSANLSAPIVYSQGKAPIQVRFPARHLWEWVFHLRPFRHLDMGERALVIPSVLFQHNSNFFGNGQLSGSVAAPLWLRPTAVDTRLVLEKTVRNLVAAAAGRGAGDDTVRDRLWQLRLLFEWVDRSLGDLESTADDKKTTGSEDTTDTGGKYVGMWLGKDIIEDARWKIWGLQVGDGAGGRIDGCGPDRVP